MRFEYVPGALPLGKDETSKTKSSTGSPQARGCRHSTNSLVALNNRTRDISTAAIVKTADPGETIM